MELSPVSRAHCGVTSALPPAWSAGCVFGPYPGWRACLFSLGHPGSCPELLLSRCFPAVVRKLQDFELPYVSVTSLHNPEFQIILRKRCVGDCGAAVGWCPGLPVPQRDSPLLPLLPTDALDPRNTPEHPWPRHWSMGCPDVLSPFLPFHGNQFRWGTGHSDQWLGRSWPESHPTGG